VSTFFDANVAADKTKAAHANMLDVLNARQREAVSEWLDALELQQVAAMRDCKVELLPEQRIRMKQLSALSYAALTGETTGHVF